MMSRSRSFRLAAALAGALPLLAVPATAQPQAGHPASSATAAYLATAGAADLYEVQASRLAMTRATTPQLRGFAEMLVGDHTRSTEELIEAAHRAGLAPGRPSLSAAQQQMLGLLNGAQGAAFDRLYLAQQIPAHEQGLALHRGYAAHGDTPELRQTAANIVPVVERHLNAARQLAR